MPEGANQDTRESPNLWEEAAFVVRSAESAEHWPDTK